MVKHIVMWTLKDEAEGATKAENLEKLEMQLKALPAIIHEIQFFEVGLNFNPSPAAFDVVLISQFKDSDALERYKKHPDHVKVADFIRSITQNGAVVDYEV